MKRMEGGTGTEGQGWRGTDGGPVVAGGLGQEERGRQGTDRGRRGGKKDKSRQEVQEHGDGCALAAGSHLQVWLTQRDQEAPGQVRVGHRCRTLPQLRPAGPAVAWGPCSFTAPLSVPAGCHGWGPAARQPQRALGVRGRVAAAGSDPPGHHGRLAGPLPGRRGLAQPPAVQRPPPVHGAGHGVPARRR